MTGLIVLGTIAGTLLSIIGADFYASYRYDRDKRFVLALIGRLRQSRLARRKRVK